MNEDEPTQEGLNRRKGPELSPEQQKRMRAKFSEAEKKIRAGLQAAYDRLHEHERGRDRVYETIESIQSAMANESEGHVTILGLLMAFVSAAAVIGLFLVFTHATTWPGAQWLRSHPNSLRLQIGGGLVVLLGFLSVFIRPWRKTCFWVGVFGVLLVLLDSI